MTGWQKILAARKAKRSGSTTRTTGSAAVERYRQQAIAKRQSAAQALATHTRASQGGRRRPTSSQTRAAAQAVRSSTALARLKQQITRQQTASAVAFATHTRASQGGRRRPTSSQTATARQSVIRSRSRSRSYSSPPRARTPSRPALPAPPAPPAIAPAASSPVLTAEAIIAAIVEIIKQAIAAEIGAVLTVNR